MTVYLPTRFRRATAGLGRTAVTAADVASMLDAPESFFGGLAASLHDGDAMAIIPALAGERTPS